MLSKKVSSTILLSLWYDSILDWTISEHSTHKAYNKVPTLKQLPWKTKKIKTEI